MVEVWAIVRGGKDSTVHLTLDSGEPFRRRGPDNVSPDLPAKQHREGAVKGACARPSQGVDSRPRGASIAGRSGTVRVRWSPRKSRRVVLIGTLRRPACDFNSISPSTGSQPCSTRITPLARSTSSRQSALDLHGSRQNLDHAGPLRPPDARLGGRGGKPTRRLFGRADCLRTQAATLVRLRGRDPTARQHDCANRSQEPKIQNNSASSEADRSCRDGEDQRGA